jgi:hypothetical protein
MQRCQSWVPRAAHPGFAALAMLLQACATAGPPPDASMAVIASQGTVVHTIDDRNVRDDTADPSRARFEIPPGRHTVEVSLHDGAASPAGQEAPKVIAVCFGAEAGHTYRTRAVVEGGQWRPEVIDEVTEAAVQRPCPATPEPDAPVAAAQAPATEGPAPSRPTSLPVAASLPMVTTPVPLDTNLPGSGLNVGLGFFFGGKSLFDATFINAPDRSLSAGRGVQISVGGLWTPLWVEDRVGFGVGGSLGWKYDSISAVNGSASLRRFPVSATAHSLIRLNRRWFTLLSGGVATEVGGHLSGDGFAAGIDSDLSATVGLLAEAQLCYGVERVALGAGLRYTSLSDRVQGTKIDASSLGLLGTGQYSF